MPDIEHSEPYPDVDRYGPPPSGHLNAGPYYLPNLIAAIAASVGIVIGSVGPWASVLAFTTNAVGGDGTITLILGIICGVALFTLLNVGRTSVGLRWRVPVAWIVPIAGLLCLVVAIADIVTLLSSTTTEAFGVSIRVQVEWGLWLVAISSAALCVTATVVAVQVAKVTEGSEPWTPTAVVIAVAVATLMLVALGDKPARRTRTASTSAATQTPVMHRLTRRAAQGAKTEVMPILAAQRAGTNGASRPGQNAASVQPDVAQTVFSAQPEVTQADAELASELIASGVTTQSVDTVIAVLSSHGDGASINAAAKASGINYRTAQRIVEAGLARNQHEYVAAS